MYLSIRDIDENNWKEVIDLKVGNEQESFIESNIYSIAESKVFDYWVPSAIYLDDNIIGFAMFGYVPCEDRVWLDRFMIDHKYQGKGYGKKALLHILKHLSKKFNTNKVFLSIFEDNINAIALYKKLGFKFNGELDFGGEKVMEISIN